VTVNNQGYPNNSAIAVQITRARQAGLKLLAMVLDDELVGPMERVFSASTHSIFDLIKLHHPTAKIIVRWYLTGPWGNVIDAAGNMLLQEIGDPTKTQTIGVNSPTAAWATAAAANLSIALANLDAAFPGRIAGVVFEGLDGGEWFVQACGMTGPESRLIGDYSPEMKLEFCAAEEEAGHRGGATDCRLPTASERDTPTLGNALLQWSKGTDPSARSFRYHLLNTSLILSDQHSNLSIDFRSYLFYGAGTTNS
jgi:hypothetical protein